MVSGHDIWGLPRTDIPHTCAYLQEELQFYYIFYTISWWTFILYSTSIIKVVNNFRSTSPLIFKSFKCVQLSILYTFAFIDFFLHALNLSFQCGTNYILWILINIHYTGRSNFNRQNLNFKLREISENDSYRRYSYFRNCNSATNFCNFAF